MGNFSKKRWIIAILFLLELWGANGCEGARHVANSGDEQSKITRKSNIHWMDWGQEVFARAQEEDKLILLDLTAVWCHACHVMEDTTYHDPEIISLINTHFIPLRVDTDQWPDVEARYRHGGWPTTSILLPTGEILFQANLLDSEDLRDALLNSQALYHREKEDLIKQAAAVWDQVALARKIREVPKGPISPGIVDQAALSMVHQFDSVHGGFRKAPKFFEPDAISFAFLLAHYRKDQSFLDMALFTLDQQRKLIDPVWGGFYRYAEQRNWSHPHHEKMLNIQAGNLVNYLEAYQVTGDKKYEEVVKGIIAYVMRFLTDPEGRGFYASHDADLVLDEVSSQTVVPGETFFNLNERERVRVGIPKVDRRIYTGWNGLMAYSYLKVSQVLEEIELQRLAMQVLNLLYEKGYQTGKGIIHRLHQEPHDDKRFLADQVEFASALLEAASMSGDPEFLRKAEQFGKDLTDHWQDHQGGGFYDRPPGKAEIGLLKFAHKPVVENLRASIFFMNLFYQTEKAEYRIIAERTLRYVLSSVDAPPVSLTAIAVDRVFRYPPHVVVVGPKSHPLTHELLREGLRVYAPGKIVRWLDSDLDNLAIGSIRFPESSTPRVYICTATLCSQPIEDVEAIAPQLAEVLELL